MVDNDPLVLKFVNSHSPIARVQDGDRDDRNWTLNHEPFSTSRGDPK